MGKGSSLKTIVAMPHVDKNWIFSGSLESMHFGPRLLYAASQHDNLFVMY